METTSAKHTELAAELKTKLTKLAQQFEFTQGMLEDGVGLKFQQTAQQSAIHADLKAHLKLERLEGREIQPATRQDFSGEGKEDDDLCRELEKGEAATVEKNTRALAQVDGLDW